MLQWHILVPSEVNEDCASQPNPNLLSPRKYINRDRQPRPQVAFPKAMEKRPGEEVKRPGTSQCQWHISKQELLNPDLNLTISRGTEPTAVWKRKANEGILRHLILLMLWFFLGCYHGNRRLGGYHLCSRCPCYAHSPDRLYLGQILETN